eukprot:4730397-Pleurochrysis_carterae.AAC.2
MGATEGASPRLRRKVPCSPRRRPEERGARPPVGLDSRRPGGPQEGRIILRGVIICVCAIACAVTYAPTQAYVKQKV